jgi:uncharacterized protein
MKSNLFVFDTNCLVSALLIPSSTSRRALKKADENGHLIFSKDTIVELNEVLIRTKFDKYVSLEERLEYIKRLEARGKIIQITSAFTDCRDVRDNKFLDLAYDGNALCIISGDADLQILNPFHHIAIISPANFLYDFAL